MSTNPIVESLADLIEWLNANNPEVDLGRRITHHVHLHFGYDDRVELIPPEVNGEAMLLISEVRFELNIRKENRKKEKFGVKVERTPDGLVPRACHRGAYVD